MNNKIKISILHVILILCMKFSHAQSFSSMPPGFNSQLISIFADSVTGIVYAGGYFWQLGGNIIPMSRISRWTGSQWDSLSSGVNDGGGIRTITRYNGQVYAGGSFNTIGGIVSKGLASWDGFQWNFVANLIDIGGYGFVTKLIVEGNDLYVTGGFDSINGTPVNSIAKFDGTNWTTFPVLDPDPNINIGSAIIYNSELYVVGNFNAGPGKAIIVKYDGTNWVTVGGGFSNFNTSAYGMVVYQGELYVIGNFYTSAGNPGNCIAKWNGASWSAVSTGVTYPQSIFCITVFNNEIYVGGNFTNIGGVPVTFIARWDGSTWHDLGTPLDNGVNCFSPWGNDLYIGGAFLVINGDTMLGITRYSLTTGFESLEPEENKTEIFPNPAQDILNITIAPNFTAAQFILYDAMGRRRVQSSKFKVQKIKPPLTFLICRRAFIFMR